MENLQRFLDRYFPGLKLWPWQLALLEKLAMAKEQKVAPFRVARVSCFACGFSYGGAIAEPQDKANPISLARVFYRNGIAKGFIPEECPGCGAIHKAIVRPAGEAETKEQARELLG